MTARHIPAGMGLCTSAGWNQLEEDWRFFLESPGSGAFLAELGGRPVGTAAFVRYEGLAWIAMMLVDPAERGMGIGTQLFKKALEAVDDAPCVGLDATPVVGTAKNVVEIFTGDWIPDKTPKPQPNLPTPVSTQPISEENQ